jgi:fructoselysine 6-kinase
MAISAVCVGDNCVDYYLPPINRQYIGGNAVNAAVYLQRFGVRASYVGVVGDDADGALTLRKLREEGVDVSHVQVVAGRTATTHILLSPSREREFVYEYLGPQPILELDDATLRAISRSDLVHNTMAGGTGRYFLRFKQMEGLIISLDYGDRSCPEFIANTLPYIDLAFFSLNEEQRSYAEDLARDKFSHGPKLIVITLGIGGSVAYDGNMYYQASIPVEVTDTLGAGDAYIGTFLAGWLSGAQIPICMNQATLAASQACTHYGAWSQSENPKIQDLSPDNRYHQ